MILDKVLELLRRYRLCHNCLGRQFALLLHGMDNSTRGLALKYTIAFELHRRVLDEKAVPEDVRLLASNMGLKEFDDAVKALGFKLDYASKPCYICGGVFDKVEEVVSMVLDALTGYEFKSILVGVKLPSEVCEKEDEVRSVVALPYGESLREELSRVLGKKLSSILKAKVDMRKPDVTVVVDPYRMMVEVNPAPIYVKGFFLKLSPEVPVVSKDLERVGGETVETLIVRPLMKAFEAVDYRFIIPFRDSKRTLILGDGRPFVVRFKHPRKRFVDLDELASEINSRASGLMEVRRLSWASRSDVAKLRSFKGVEEAKVLVKAEKALRFMGPMKLTVMQLDKPSNVFREETVELLDVERVGGDVYRLRLKYRVGFLVKDFLSGGPRVKPSLKEILKSEMNFLEIVEINVRGAF
ncbi:MAG: hypothetical protein AYL29_009350 [Candidatus Bathyarchaeota archaeon B24]|nr:MAG: hypothetical protein AYL29_009350 [Candidatus Bathyarchaeota archaeon B24]